MTITNLGPSRSTGDHPESMHTGGIILQTNEYVLFNGLDSDDASFDLVLFLLGLELLVCIWQIE